MIKVKVNNEYKDVVKIFCGGTLQKEIIKVWSREAQEYVYESSVEYTGTLPVTITANGDALIDYRIYGTDGGVGVATENLFDKNTITPNSFLKSNGTIDSTPLFSISDFIPVENGDYLVHRARSGYSGPYHCVYDENKNFVRSIVASISNMSIIIGDNEKYIRISVNSSDDDLNRLNVCMVVKGTTAPTKYEPYGYKLPMTVGDGNTAQTVPIYIGENQLDAISEYSDYVDNASGKIVRYIKEYTFTGKEAFLAAYGYAMRFVNPKFNDANSDSGKITCFSNFFNAIPNDTIYGFKLYAPDGSIGFRRNDDEIVLKDSTKFTTSQECINYLKSQYDNGTPVKFWYVLEIPIEEDPPVPLPEIPTIKGETVIDYDGTPKPSQMYVKYRR